ncbi:MAG TPA: TonB-dependent receptor [Gemmatimonadales bacterium]|jgi:outer membrane receptor protein involved in Fe transport
MAACCAGAKSAAAQQPDTGKVSGDSLTRNTMMMHAVTITTTKPRRDEPVAAVRVTPEVIARTPAENPWDLLRQTAGVEVHDQGQGPGFASDASIRGFSSDHSTDLALWIDGVPINEPVNGHAEGYNDWSLLMPQAVQSIEVLKGPVSALYGNFALSGVVNVRTSERDSGAVLTGSVGAFGRLEGSLVTGFDHGANGGVIAFRGLKEDGWRRHSGYDLGQAHARIIHQFSDQLTLDAGLELYASGWDSPGFISDSVFQLHQYNGVSNFTDGGFKRHAQERVSLRQVIGTTALWRTTAYATQGRWQLFMTLPPEGGLGEGLGSQTEEEDQRHGYGATSALTWILPRGEVTTGVEGRWDRADYQRWFTTDRIRDSSDLLVGARQISGAAFVQTSFDLTPHVRLQLGGRYDAANTQSTPAGGSTTSETHGIMSPKAGLLLHLPFSGAVYGNVSRGFRETDGIIADPTLPFITAWSYESGVKFDRGRVSATAALFRIDVSNEQTFNPVTLQSTSGGQSRRQGVELETNVRITSAVSADADFTLNNAKYLHLVTSDGDTLDGARVFNTARYVGVAGITLAPVRQRWNLRLATNLLGQYTPFDEPGVELPSYALVNFGGGIKLGRDGGINLGIRNLFDVAYRELRAAGFVSPGQPRSFYASMRASW